MSDFLAWVGKLGRPGGVVLLALAALFGGMSVTLGSESLPDGTWFYSPALWLFTGFFALSGLFLLVTGGVWRRDQRWKPMTDDALQAALQSTSTPFCVCLDCRVVLPYEVAVGRCPRCESASACLEIFGPKERNDALVAAGFERSSNVVLEGLKREYLAAMHLRGAEGEAYVAERLEKLRQTKPGHDDVWYLRWLLEDLARARR